AEDGIRDKLVTGVQTCALPIFDDRRAVTGLGAALDALHRVVLGAGEVFGRAVEQDAEDDADEARPRRSHVEPAPRAGARVLRDRSEERRVGKESSFVLAQSNAK